MPPPRLELTQIRKRYPGVLANDDVSLTVQPGEIHAVLGENGAGKSTLMKIIYGAVRPDEGSIRWNGQPVQIANPQQARALGISMVFQHFSLFDTLTAAENVWLGLDRRMRLPEVTERIRTVSKDYGLEVDPLRPVHTLSVGEMQRVEIIRALLTEPRLLILDEPTSVLTPQAVDKLFVTLRRLAGEGCSILYISHKLHEIRALCSACTVMRSGRVTGVCDPRQESNASLSRLMIGAEPPELAHRPQALGARVLQVERLDLKRESPFGVHLVDLSLQVRAGGDEVTVVTVDRDRRELAIDRRRSGAAITEGRFLGEHRIAWDGAVAPVTTLRVIVDACSVEVFTDDGLAALTELVFPQPGSTGVRLVADAPVLLQAFDCWPLADAMPGRD